MQKYSNDNNITLKKNIRQLKIKILDALSETEQKVFVLDETNKQPKEPENSRIITKYENALISSEQTLNELDSQFYLKQISYAQALKEYLEIEDFVIKLISHAEKTNKKDQDKKLSSSSKEIAKLTKCSDCNKRISKKSEMCPHCGSPRKICLQCKENLIDSSLSHDFCAVCSEEIDKIVKESLENSQRETYNSWRNIFIQFLVTTIFFVAFIQFLTWDSSDNSPSSSSSTASRSTSRSAADEWYSGGTLHAKTAGDWLNASEKNRLATAADFAASKKEKWGINTIEDLKGPATQISTCITEAAKGDAGQEVSTLAALCTIMLTN